MEDTGNFIFLLGIVWRGVCYVMTMYCCDSIPLLCFCMHVCIVICLLLCVRKVSCLSRAWLSCSATKLLALILCVTHACVILFWTLGGLRVAFVRSMCTAMFYSHWVDFCRFCRIRIISLLHVTTSVSLNQILVLCLPRGLLCCSSSLVSLLYSVLTYVCTSMIVLYG